MRLRGPGWCTALALGVLAAETALLLATLAMLVHYSRAFRRTCWQPTARPQASIEVRDPLFAMTALLRRGVLALPVGEGRDFALALVPPLTISDEQMDFVVDALVASCAERAQSV